MGRVELGAKNQDISSKVDGQPVANLAIFQLPDANALDTADIVKAKIEELKKDFPDGRRLHDPLRHDAVHPRVDPGGVQDAARFGGPGRAGRAGVPAELAVGDHPA